MRYAAIFTAISIALTATACNDASVVNGVEQTPTPTPEPTPALQGPVAVLSASSPIYSTNETGAFDGSYSYDMDLGGYITDYTFSITQKPAGSNATIALDPFGNNQIADISFDMAGDYTVQLMVKDNHDLTDTTTVSFSASPSDFHVQLSWPGFWGQEDLDLHVINKSAGGVLWDMSKDCHYRNCPSSSLSGHPDWGVTGNPDDDPRQDVDDVYVSVPENTVIVHPADGTYHVAIHAYGMQTATADAIVTIWTNTNLAPAFTATKTFTAVDQVWDVADVTWLTGGGTVTPIDTMTTTTKP